MRLFRLDRVLAKDAPELAGPALVPGAVLPLDPHRFGRVLRLAVGDVLTLADATGARYAATCVSATPPLVEVTAVLGSSSANPRHPLEVWLPLLKGGKTDDLIRPLIELGATRIVPFSSQNSVVRLDKKKALERQTRLQAIADESCQQCGRSDQPTVAVPVDHLPTVGPGLFLWEVPFEGVLPDDATNGAPHVLTGRVLSGPEGGLTNVEAERLVSLGWVPHWLGPRILRAETATLVLATLVQVARDELPSPPR